MRIISLNANGIRAAARKGFFDWLDAQNADIVCIQETKAQEHQLEDPCYRPEKHQCVYVDAKKPGYSGVAIYSRHQPDRVTHALGWDPFDSEGRWVQMDFGRLSVVSLYLPSGSSSEDRQAFKFEVMDWLMPQLEAMAASGREMIICGDWNIAHREIDLKNWRANRKNSGFLPEERAWMDRLFGSAGWVDTFRRLKPDAPLYTWWSNRGRAWDNDVGWRIDYQVATPGIAEAATATSIYRQQRFSDHAPLTIDYDWSL